MKARLWRQAICDQIAFFTVIRLPTHAREGSEPRFEGIGIIAPILGALLGCVMGFVLWLVNDVTENPAFAAVLALAMGTAITGALHEDGLADSADGLLGGRDRPDRLRIMREGAVGVFGVLLLLTVILLRFVSFETLAVNRSGLAGSVCVLAWAAGGSRCAMLMLPHLVPPCPSAGVARRCANAPLWTVSASSIAFAVAGAHLLPGTQSLLTVGLACGGVTFLLVLFRRALLTRISGYTGDTLGATQQVSEAVLLSTFLMLHPSGG